MITFENGYWIPDEELMFRNMRLELRRRVLGGEWKLKRGDFIEFKSNKGKR